MEPPRPLPPPGTGGGDGLTGDGLTIEVLPGDAGLRLAGDADMASIGRLRAALARLPAGQPVQLELAGLRFADVAGTREMMAVTLAQPPRRLVLRDPPPSLRRIIGLLWRPSQVEIQMSTPPVPPFANGRSRTGTA